jgi:hypothetical protein
MSSDSPQDPSSVNLTVLFRDVEEYVNELNYPAVSRVFLGHVFERVTSAFLERAGESLEDAPFSRCLGSVLRVIRQISAPWVEEEPLGGQGDGEGGQIPLPDVFFHSQLPTNHLLRVMAPERDSVIRCEVLLSLCRGLSKRFDNWAVALYVVRVALMQCVDFSRAYYSQHFAYAWLDEEVLPSAAGRLGVGRIVCALYNVKLLETAFNSLPYMAPDISTECVL